MKTIRADLLIATLALLASSGATLSSVYQTHVIANQLSASVWPYLEAVYSLSTTTANLEVANDGLGPALVRSASLAVDGHPVATARYGLSRPDVAATYGVPAYAQSGFSAVWNDAGLPRGRHTLRLSAQLSTGGDVTAGDVMRFVRH